jgi:hypothetical protein
LIARIASLEIPPEIRAKLVDDRLQSSGVRARALTYNRSRHPGLRRNYGDKRIYKKIFYTSSHYFFSPIHLILELFETVSIAIRSAARQICVSALSACV